MFSRSFLNVFVSLIILLLQISTSQSITCYCNVCGTNECVGTTCFLRVFVSSSNRIMEEYGCFRDVIIPNQTEGVCNRNGTLRFECCSHQDYCNENFTNTVTVLFNSPTSSLNSTAPTVPVILKGTGESLYIIIPVTILATCCVGLIPCAVFILIIIKLVKRSGRRERIHTSTSHTPKINGHQLHDTTYVQTLPCSSTSMEPVHITLSNELSLSSSGSGAGTPFLVKRTIARSITLSDPVGSGRFGQVYLGYYQGERYAVKKFFSKDEASWFHESDIYNTFNLRHENILTCFATDMLSNNGVTELWLITQYYPRGSLYEELNKNKQTPEITLKLLTSACRGLIYLHTELAGTQGKPSIAHRDIKSKNILVKNDDTCCIADFGMAIVNDNTFSSYNKDPKEIQQGTKRYMPPEVLTGTVNVKIFESFLRGDIYCFGLVMWEVTRRCPISELLPELEYSIPFQSQVPPDPSIEEMRNAIIDKELIPDIPSDWKNNDLHNGLSVIMKECWYRDPAERPTALYIRKKLDKIADACEIKLNLS